MRNATIREIDFLLKFCDRFFAYITLRVNLLEYRYADV